jgi:preprotein translocase subunit SecE
VRGFRSASDEPLGWIESDMDEEVSVRKDESRALGQAKGVGYTLKPAAEAVVEIWQRVKQYVSGVRTETKRVTWPGMQEVYGTTVMVILTTFLFGIYFWICDQVFQYAVSHALRYFMHRG